MIRNFSTFCGWMCRKSAPQTIDLSDYVTFSGAGGRVRGLAPALRKLAKSAPAGTILDARKLTGEILLESNPFQEIAEADVEFRTGAAVFRLAASQFSSCLILAAVYFIAAASSVMTVSFLPAR